VGTVAVDVRGDVLVDPLDAAGRVVDDDVLVPSASDLPLTEQPARLAVEVRGQVRVCVVDFP